MPDDHTYPPIGEHLTRPSVAPASPASPGPTAIALLMFFGVVSLGAGLILLLFMPEVRAPDFSSEPIRVFNLQRGFLGMTLSIVGAIFLAAGMRPLSGGAAATHAPTERVSREAVPSSEHKLDALDY